MPESVLPTIRLTSIPLPISKDTVPESTLLIIRLILTLHPILKAIIRAELRGFKIYHRYICPVSFGHLTADFSG